MISENKKFLFILSNGSTTFSYCSNYFSTNTFLFYTKDSINLNKKKSVKKIKLESVSSYKNKYLTN
jgi:hypothetical protein